MKYFKSYENYKTNSLNEALTDTIKGWFGNIKNYFKIKGPESFKKFDFGKLLLFFKEQFGKKGWLYNLFFLQKEGYLDTIGVNVHDKNYKNAIADISSANAPKGMFEKYGIDSTDDAFYLEESDMSFNFLNEDLKHPDPEILNLNPKQLVEKIKMHYKAQNDHGIHLPLFIWGAPGIGKTDVVNDTADDLDLTAITIDLSLKDPVDFIGVPMPEKHFTASKDGERKPTLDKEGNPVYKTIYAVPKIFPDESEAVKGGIIFFDEMNRANPSVLNASLQFICNRKLNGYELPHNWIIIAASNRPHIDDEGMSEIGKALGNRFAQVNMFVTVEDWIKWARSKKAMTKPIDKNDEKFVPEYYVSPELMSFLQFNDEYFHKNPTLDAATSVFPTPRSWSRASKLLLVSKKINPNLSKEDMVNIFAPEVGQKAALLFVAFNDLIRAIDPKKLELIFTDPDKAPVFDDKFAKSIKDMAEKKEKDSPEYKALFVREGEGGLKPDIIRGLLTYTIYLRRNKPTTLKEVQNAMKYANKLNSFEWASLFAKEVFTLIPNFLEKYPAEAENLLNEFMSKFGQALGVEE
jgi:hypothetical protein